MKTIASLFGKSPFGPLQAHVVKVNDCVKRLRPLFDAVIRRDEEEVENLVEEICELEREADNIKNDLRDSLPRSLFLPAARSDLLVLLEVLDSVADAAQDVAILAGIRRLTIPEMLQDDLLELVDYAQESSKQLLAIFDKFHDLLEGSFRGKAAEEAFESIQNVGKTEHCADEVALSLMKRLYNLEDGLSVQDLLIMDKLLNNLGRVSDFSRKAANRLRVILAR